MPNHLLSWSPRWIPALTGALLLLTENPVLAANPPRKSVPASAEQCRQLAALWWGNRTGIEFEKIDPAVAVPACQRAVKEHPNNADLKAYLCRTLLKARRLKDALTQCRPAVDGGSPTGMTSLGEIFEHGLFKYDPKLDGEGFSEVFDLLESFRFEDEEDAAQAVAWYRKAAERGYPPAQNNLGGMYANGSGVEQDEAQAVAWYRKAAERGYPPAQNNLGGMYANGSGVEQDEAQAVAWYRKVIERKDADTEVRTAAARALGGLKDSQRIDLLIVALRDANTEVRKVAAEALGELQDPQAVEPLLVALRDADAEVRTAAIGALASQAAAGVLGRSRDPRVVEPLIAALRDTDVFVRTAAVSALGYLQDPQAVEPLIAALQDTDRDVRQNAPEGSVMTSMLFDILDKAEKGVRRNAAQALGELQDPQAVEPLLAALRDTDKGVREAAIRALVSLKDLRAIDLFIDTLQDADVDVDVRQAAAKALGDLQDLRAVEPLIAALRDTDKGVREAATRALVGLGDPRSIEPLTTALQDVDESVREAAGGVLKLKDPQAVEPLIAALQDANVRVRKAAAEALGKLKDPRGVEPLIVALRDTEKYVRSEAAEALGKLKDPRGVEPLITTLRDVDDYVRLVTAHALGHLQDLRAVEPLIAALRDADEGVRGGAAWALGALEDSQAVEPLIAALRDPDARVRKLAAQALGDFKDLQVVESLVAMLGDTDADVRKAVAKSLGYLEDSRAVEPLLAMLGDADPDLRKAAVWAFRDLKDPRAVKPLFGMLEDTNRYVREPAFWALIAHFPVYARGVLDLIHLSTKGITYYPYKLEILGELWKWGNKQAVAKAVLDADLAALRAAAGAEAVAANPYLALFVARLHQEQNRTDAALTWIERARTHLPAHEIASQIVLGWIEAQALRQAGRPEPALAVVTRLERELLPRLAGIERRESGLPFNSQTLALKGILLGELGQRRAGIEALYAATDARARERQRDWITETTGQQVQQVISGFQAALLDQESKALAEASLNLAEQNAPTSRLGQEAELKALESRLRAALGDGDAALAQKLTETWLLKQQAVPPSPGDAASDRQRTIQRLQDLQNRLQQLAREQDAAERAVRQAAERRLSGNDAEKAPEADPADAQRKLAEVQAQRAQARQALTDFMHTLKTEHPDLAALYGTEPQELSRLQSRLHPDQRLVQYLLLEDQGWAFVAAATQLQVVPLGVGRLQLRDTIDRYRELVQLSAVKRGFTLTASAPPTTDPAELARNLSAVLLEPLRPHLGEAQHLLLVLNGPLHRLPFAALPWDGGFLVQRFRLSTLSSASLLTALPDALSATAPPLIALADATPDAPLPEAAAEAQAIAKHFSEPAVYLRDQARRDRLLGQDLSGRILHLAVHGQAATPDRTRLRLSDGDLSYRDVTGLRLDAAPLVVLSACETGLGAQLSGDEVVSLANGFVSAGARAVVSSLWPVPDPETKALMETFYDHRPEGHAAALAVAQRALIAQGRDPYYWAGFVVGGW